MKRLAIRLSGVFHDEQPLDDAYYLASYLELADALARRNVETYIVKDDRFYLGGNRFARGWRLEGGKAVLFSSPVEADLLFCKDSSFKPDAQTRVVNAKAFDDLCNDKKKVAALFPEWSAKTITVETAADVDAAFAAIPSQTIVVKPLNAFGGEGVFIGKREEARCRVPGFPCLAQEFIDTSDGIPGVTETFHDFRMIVADEEVIFSFIRTPRRGSLVSNFALGGWMTPIRPASRPREALDLCAAVDKRLRGFGHRIYCVDCARDISGAWKLIELNAPPGQQNRLECGDDADSYFDASVEFFVRCMDERDQRLDADGAMPASNASRPSKRRQARP